MEVTSNAGEVAAALEAAAADLGDLEATNAEAGRLALEAIDTKTPRRTGTLAAGGRSVADPFRFAYVNAVPYAAFVDAQSGFATDTLTQREASIVAVYQDHIEEATASLR